VKAGGGGLLMETLQGSREIESYLVSGASNRDGLVMEKLGGIFSIKDKISDPKLFALMGGVWVTFNSGYKAEGNKLYLAKIYPNRVGPFECDYRDRRLTEKNWAFFLEEGKLRCVYSLAPLIILECKSDFDARSQNLIFEKVFGSSQTYDHRYAIGTPLISDESGQKIIIHKKYFLFGKRLYLGCPARVNRHADGEYSLKIFPRLLAHNFWSIFGARSRRNHNLISCTYFSGIKKSAGSSDNFVLAYGVNDMDFGFCSILANELWT